MSRPSSKPLLRVVAVPAFLAAWQAGAWQLRAQQQAIVVSDRVATIIARVRRDGQHALSQLTAELDGVELASPVVSPDELARQAAACPQELREALVAAGQRLEVFARQSAASLRPSLADVDPRSPLGVTEAWSPLATVGIYVPGGRAPYPSSVLMTAVPARAAGVPELVFCTPPTKEGTLHPAIAAAALVAGVTRVFLIGGAQAIAAMALGAGEVPRVDKVVGPGNAYVNEAKRQLFGECGFDGLAGPSEVIAVAGRPGAERDLAWQLLAQAEHGLDGLPLGVVLPGVDPDLVLAEIARGIERLPLANAQAAADSLGQRGALIIAVSTDEAVQVVRAVRPEHTWIELADGPASRRLALAVAPFAGAVYVGAGSPVAAGDYAAGPSHVLPTGGSARWRSPLGPVDFMRRVSLVEIAPSQQGTIAGIARIIATAEGFVAHAVSLPDGERTTQRGRGMS